jgi:hypothetical protein
MLKLTENNSERERERERERENKSETQKLTVTAAHIILELQQKTQSTYIPLSYLDTEMMMSN